MPPNAKPTPARRARTVRRRADRARRRAAARAPKPSPSIPSALSSATSPAPLGLMAQAWYDACEIPEREPIYQWAARHVDLPLGYQPSGRFSIEQSRHLIAPLDALHPSSRYRMVNILKATQTGGTLIADLFVPWTIDNDPGWIMWNWLTDELAKQHAESRANPVILGCRRTARLLTENRHRTRTQEIQFRNGVWLWIQGPSTANLQGKSIRYLINDELWEWKPSRIKEALARVTQAYRAGTSKVLNISQGGDINTDWHKLCLDAEWHEWEVPCPHCKQFFQPKLEEMVAGRKVFRMKWDEAGNNIRMECPHCAGEMRDTPELKAMWNAQGRYRHINPNVESENVTFHWNSLIWLPWAFLVPRYVRAARAAAQGYFLDLREFVQKVLAEFWDERRLLEARPVETAVADYDPLAPWPEEQFRFMTVDCQANLTEFYVVIRAWCATGSRRLYRGRVSTFEALRDLQVRFGVRSQFVTLDSGYQGTTIYRQCCRHVDETGRGWVAFKGTDQPHFTHHLTRAGQAVRERRIYSEKIYADPSLGLKNADTEKWLATVSPQALALYREGRLRCALYQWSNPNIKDILANLRDGRGMAWLRPAADATEDEEANYARQLAGEIKRKRTDPRGQEKWEWHCIGPNHYFDCECMQVVCAVIAGIIGPSQIPTESASEERTEA